ncbi:MAG: hypothetical protein PEPC_00758 [Peptostreptococcus russellii]
MRHKKIIALVFMTAIFMTACVESKESATRPEDLWRKNPVDVVSYYVEHLGDKKRLEYVYSDIDLEASKDLTKVNFIDTEEDGKSNELEKIYKNSIESSELISVRPDKNQENNENPIEIKNKNGKTVKLYDPITLEVSFKTNYKENAERALPYEKDYPNERIFMLAKDSNGDYKIISIYN